MPLVVQVAHVKFTPNKSVTAYGRHTVMDEMHRKSGCKSQILIPYDVENFTGWLQQHHRSQLCLHIAWQQKRFISDLWRHIYVAEFKWIVHTQLDSYPIDPKCKWALTVFVLWLFQVSRGLWKEKRRIVARLEDSLGIFLNIIQKSFVLLQYAP